MAPYSDNSDQSGFGLHPDSRIICLWRRPGSAESLVDVQEVHKFQGIFIMTWRGIITNRKSELILVRGKMTAKRSETDILKYIGPPLAREYDPEFLHMHDISRPHTATTISECFENHKIPLIEWPDQSLDLNPIEYLCINLQKRVSEDTESIKAQDQLFTRLQHHWQRIHQN